MQPSVRSTGSAAEITPPGSTASMRVPSYGPPCLWKYHQGMPFCAVTTSVSGPISAPTSPVIAGNWCAFIARITTSCTPSSAMRSLAATCATCSLPSALMSFMPWARTAARLAPRITTLTCSPMPASRTAR